MVGGKISDRGTPKFIDPSTFPPPLNSARQLTRVPLTYSPEQELARGKALQSEGATLRAIASIWADEFGLKQFDANSVRRILDRA